MATAVALTQGDDAETKQYGFVPQFFEATDLMNFMDRLGTNLIDDSVDPPKPSISQTPPWLKRFAGM